MSIYYNDIQILRFVSILLVILFHLKLNNYGYIGVDIFFAISGFITSYQFNRINNNHFSFYSARIRRLYPSSYIVLTFFYYIYYNKELYEVYKQCILFNVNSYFNTMKNDYFNPSSDSIFLHYWSLSVEMKYYIFSPILISYISINAIMSSYSMFCYIRDSKNSIFYFKLLPRFYEFNVGIYSFNKNRVDSKIFFKTFICMSYFLLSFINYIPNSYIIPVVVCLSYLFLSTNEENFKCNILEYIGDMSFVIYLVHYPFTQLLKGNILKYLIFLFLFSIIFNYIDKKMQMYFKHKTNRLIIVSFLLSAMVLLLLSKYILTYIIPKSNTKDDYSFSMIGLNDYECFKNNDYKRKSIIIIGDSHSLPLIGVVFNFCRNRGIYIYYKYIHTQYILDYTVKYLEDINTSFCLAIYTNYVDERYHHHIENYINNTYRYFQYLLLFTSKIIYILPTPVLKKWNGCNYLKIKKYIHINNFILNTNFNYSIIERMINVRLLNITKRMCNSTYCNVSFNNTCIFKDYHHFYYKYFQCFVSEIIEVSKQFCIMKMKKKNMNNNFFIYKNKIHSRWHLNRRKECKIISLPVHF